MKYMGMIKSILVLVTVVIISFTAALPAFSSDVLDPKKERLEQRVNTYYETRKSGRTEISYTYYDPFFRARVSRKLYEGNLFEIRFYEIKLLEAKITENIAKVRIEAEFEIPETVVFGKQISLPKKKDIWEDDWAWIDGDWYKVFKVNVNNTYIPFFPSFPP